MFEESLKPNACFREQSTIAQCLQDDRTDCTSELATMASSQAPHLTMHVLRGQFPELGCAKGAEMDAFVWSRLPDELMERVLALLSLEGHRFRSLVSF